MTLRTQEEPLPRSVDKIISYFKRAMTLSNLMEVKVTTETFSVTREMDEDDTSIVFPKTESKAEVDIDYLLSRIVDNLHEPLFDPTKNPYIALMEATAHLGKERLRVCGMMVPKGSLFSDYFGLPEGEMPESFMGIRVIYHTLEDKYPDKIMVFGGPTFYFNDATHGVLIDTGV